MRIRAGTLDLETVSVLGVNVRILRNLNFGLGIYLAGLAGVLAAGMLGLQPTIGASLIMPSFVAIIVGGLGSLPGTLLGGLLIGVASGVTTVFFPSATEAVIYVMMAAGAAGAPARPAGRGRAGSDERDRRQQAGAERRRLAAAADDAVLDAARSAATPSSAAASSCSASPRWRSTSCSAITGVLSFGHAAYFGLGAYGAGMTITLPRAEHAARHPGRRRWSARSRRRSSAR